MAGALSVHQRARVLPQRGERRLNVGSVVEPLNGVALEGQGGVEARRLQRPGQDLLAHAQRDRLLGGDVRDRLGEPLLELVGVEDTRQEAHLVEVAGAVVLATAVDHLARPVHGHGASDPHRSSPAGQDAHVDLGGAELGRVRGVDEVAHQRQLEAAGEAVTVDLRDHDLLAQLDGLADLVAVVGQPVQRRRVIGRQRGEDAEVAARAERPSRAGENDHAYAFLVADPPEGGEQLGGHGAVDRVVLVGSIQGDGRDRAVDPVDDRGVVTHRCLRGRWGTRGSHGMDGPRKQSAGAGRLSRRASR